MLIVQVKVEEDRGEKRLDVTEALALLLTPTSRQARRRPAICTLLTHPPGFNYRWRPLITWCSSGCPSDVTGATSTASFRRSHNESLIDSLAHRKDFNFAWARVGKETDDDGGASVDSKGLPPYIAHQAGVNCLAVDQVDGRYLVSGGADSAIRLWDLEEHLDSQTSPNSSITKFTPQATLTKSSPSAHTHALTSLSIYPFDPTPSTLLSTSYDKTLKVHSITPSTLSTIHTFSLDFTPHCHALSPIPDTTPLIAVGTTHPAIRLLDLRTGFATHSLSGPNGAIYSVAWSPKQSHILASGSTDGKCLFFDIRRANAAFASLDHDDAIGVIGTSVHTGQAARQNLLDFHAVAHNGPVTSIQWSPSGDKIITTGHDQRIRVWDAASGKNDLVHFGPRIRNERQGSLRPLISPVGHTRPGQEKLFFPNDDGKGQIMVHHMREGNFLNILRIQGVKIAEVQAKSRGRAFGGGSTGNNVARLTSGGRINEMVWRVGASTGQGVEMFTAHGDGRICAWMPGHASEADDDEEEENDADAKEAEVLPEEIAMPLRGNGAEEAVQFPAPVVDEAEQRRKRKRDMLEDMLGGLSKQAMRFS